MNFPFYKQDGWVEPSTPYLKYIILFFSIVFLFEYYLDIRQYLRLKKKPDINPLIKDSVSEETYKKSIAYRSDKAGFKLFEELFSTLPIIILTFGGLVPFLWDTSLSILNKYSLLREGNSFYNESLTTWVFVMLFTIFTLFYTLPFTLYNTFVIEQKHGFNRTTLKLFIKDKIISLLLTAFFSMLVLPIIIYIVLKGGKYFYFYCWVFLFFFTIFFTFIYPTFIAPLFDKYTRLEEGELRQKIENLAKQVEFPLTELYVVDGSKRSSHSNAYFYGFFKNKRIVLFDTLIQQVSESELLAILGHEIGHWKLWHTIQGLAISQIYLFFMLKYFSLFQYNVDMYNSFGFSFSSSSELPVIIGLLLFAQSYWAPVDKVITLIMTFNSRRNEFQADNYACKLGFAKELASGLIKISIENLIDFSPDPLFSMYHYSHPPLTERLEALTKLEKKEH